MKRLQTTVLISGRGSNLMALIDACKTPDFPAEIVCVISNREDAAGLAAAEASDIATIVIPHKEFADRAAFDAAIDSELRSRGTELICLAGFMRLFTAEFIERWHDRILNIHPALLPSFKGLDAQQQALDAGVRIAGCTVHLVRHETDAGPIIVQAAVPVLQGDDADSLSARILAAEHQIYPLAVRLIAEGRVRVEGDRAVIEGSAKATHVLHNPALQ
jgi:phosphoribosylglycinamide formyltransferase-1